MTTHTPIVTIQGTSTITNFLEINPKNACQSIISPNVTLVFEYIRQPKKSTSTYQGNVYTFTYDNKFSILESSDMVQIIFEGDIVIDQNINVVGKTLTIMSFEGYVTINPAITLQASAVNIFAKNGKIKNNGTIDTAASNGNVNLFAEHITQGVITYGSGSLLVNTILTNASLPTPSCTDQLALTSIVGTSLNYALNGILQPPVSLTTNGITTFPGGSITVNTIAKVLSIIYNGGIVIAQNLDFSLAISGYATVITTPCALNALTNNLVSGADLTLLVGGDIHAGSLVTAQDGGKITITAGGSVEVEGQGAENTAGDNVNGGWAGIGGKGASSDSAGTSVGAITLTLGGDLSVQGGKTSSSAFNYGGTGSAIGGGGGSGSDIGDGKDGGSCAAIAITVGGKITATGGLAFSTYNQESGGGSAIGGGGGGGTQGLSFRGGKGGSASSTITLISGSDALIQGSHVKNLSYTTYTYTDGGAGSGVGGGGAGGNHAIGGTGNNGGSILGNVTFTIAGKIEIIGGSTTSTATGNAGGSASGIGGGGGSYQDGTSAQIIGAINLLSKDDIRIEGGNTYGSGSFNGAGAASGIGGGGGGSATTGLGGNGGDGNYGFTQLISYHNMTITGGTASASNGATLSSGNGASIGGGGGGGSDGPSQGGTGGKAGAQALLVAFGCVELRETNGDTGKDGLANTPCIVQYASLWHKPCENFKLIC